MQIARIVSRAAGQKKAACSKQKTSKKYNDKSKLKHELHTNLNIFFRQDFFNITHGIYILSTTRGIISDKLALKYNLGGKVLCKIN